MTMMRSARLCAAAILLAGTAGAQQRAGGSGISISKDTPVAAVDEKQLTRIMAAGDSLEIQLGHLAHAKGTAQGVRDYGMLLANDHTAHLATVMKVIMDDGVGAADPPANVESDRARAMLGWLQDNPASREWDAAYLRFQVQHHQNLYDLLSASIKAAHDDDLEELLRATLNSLTKHRDAARSTATVIGLTVQ